MGLRPMSKLVFIDGASEKTAIFYILLLIKDFNELTNSLALILGHH